MYSPAGAGLAGGTLISLEKPRSKLREVFSIQPAPPEALETGLNLVLNKAAT